MTCRDKRAAMRRLLVLGRSQPERSLREVGRGGDRTASRAARAASSNSAATASSRPDGRQSQMPRTLLGFVGQSARRR